MKYYTNGVFGYVDVTDVVKGMIELMHSKIKGERFIMVSENWSFKDFTHHVATGLKVIPPKKEAKRWLLQFAWRMDWLRCFFNGKPRRLTKQTVSAILDITNFSSKKIYNVLQLNFIPIEKSIAETCSQFLKDLES